MNRQGPGPQSMRTLGFSAAASSRLPNGKLGPGWAPPGVPNPQSRPSLNSLTFSQSVTGFSQPTTPLDLSEFPALGPQGQTPAAQAWNRISTQSPSQGRPQEEIFQSHLGMDDFRLAAQQQPSQLHSNSLDDFPALPRTQNGGHLGLGQSDSAHAQHQLARNAFMAAGTAFGSNQAGGPARQPATTLRQSLASPQNLQDVGGPQASRLLPLDVIQQHQQQQQNILSLSEPEKKNPSMKTPSQLGPSSNSQGLPLSLTANNLSQQSLGSQGQQQQQQLQSNQQSSIQPPQQQPQHRFQGGNIAVNGPVGAGRPQADFGDISQSSTAGPSTVAGSGNGMSLIDKYGLSGLLHTIRGDNPDLAMLALGTDLTQLGFDLNNPDSISEPLWKSFASPWADPESKPIEPDFTLPSCYSVSNIQPLVSKIQNFSDETLFYIFYTETQKMIQETVAAELTSRNWRYHKELRLWLTKEPGSTPTQLTETSEKGTYIFFDPMTWDRVRKDWILDYTQLDSRSFHQV